MTAYHGTVVRELSTLRPFANPHSNLSYPCVYLSTNKALASIYVWKWPFKWMTFEIREDGLPVYNEAYAGCLRELYAGVEGCIYRCDGDFDTDDNTTIRHAVLSKEPLAVAEADPVSDAYERILRYEQEGQLLINRYEDRSAVQVQRDRNMVLGAIKRFGLLEGSHVLSDFVSARFPQLWEEARQIAAGEKSP
jgi:hypothetical protein